MRVRVVRNSNIGDKSLLHSATNLGVLERTVQPPDCCFQVFARCWMYTLTTKVPLYGMLRSSRLCHQRANATASRLRNTHRVSGAGFRLSSRPVPNWTTIFENRGIFTLLGSSFDFLPDVIKRQH